MSQAGHNFLHNQSGNKIAKFIIKVRKYFFLSNEKKPNENSFLVFYKNNFIRMAEIPLKIRPTQEQIETEVIPNMRVYQI